MTGSRQTAGTLLGGRYRLVEPLPGAGRSWHAKDEVDNRDLVARVVALPEELPGPERDRARQRALHDAAAISRVQHAAVAHVVDAVVGDGVPWVVSVLPAGRSLGDVVRRDGPVSAPVAARIGLQVLDALVAAGVPHGDLTPDDVLLGEGGQITVTGFATTPVDGTGTPGYRAPEGGPGAAADLWALGVTLHVAVEGRLPGDAAALPAGVLRPVLDRLLAPDPAQRSDLGEVRRLLAEAAGGSPGPARSPATEIHDPEVAAALAAFEAALSTARVHPPAGEHGLVPAPRAETMSPAPRSASGSPAPPPRFGPAPERSAAPPRPPGPLGTPDRSAAPPLPPQPTAAAPERSAARPLPPQPAAAPERSAAPPRPLGPRGTPDRSAARPLPPWPGGAPERSAAPSLPSRSGAAPDRSAAPPAAQTRTPTPTRTPAPSSTRTPATASIPATTGAPAALAGAVLAPSRPARPAPYQEQPARGQDERRGWLWSTAAAVAVLAVIAALLLPFLLGRGEGHQPAAQPTAASPPTEATPSPDAAAPAPAGFTLYQDPTGWSIAVPTGWAATRNGSVVTFRSGDRILRVDHRGNPPADPYDFQLQRAPVVGAGTAGYDFMRIARVSYRGWPTADWEYRAGTNPKTHTLVRSTVPDAQHLYEISWTTRDRSWAADRTYFETAAATFDPVA